MPLPYTIHFGADADPEWDREIFTFIRENIFINEKLQPPLHIQVIRNLKDTINQILFSAMSYDRVVTFALGGVFPLDYMVKVLSESGQTVRDEKFHLFAGLNWRGLPFDPKARFIDWIDTLPDEESIILFDTGNVGNAGGQLWNLLIRHYKEDYLGTAQVNLIINIYVIVTNPDAIDRPQTQVISKGGKKLCLSLHFLNVQGNPFEDAVHFIGYERLQSSGVMVRKKFLGAINIDFGTHQNIIVGEASDGFMMLFSDSRLRLLEAINNPSISENIFNKEGDL